MAEMWISMGPQHPMTHGLWTLKVKVDGETVVDTEPDLGYIHRGVEKICEARDFTQITTYCDRLCYASANTWSHAYIYAAEDLLEVEVPWEEFVLQRQDPHRELEGIEIKRPPFEKLQEDQVAGDQCGNEDPCQDQVDAVSQVHGFLPGSSCRLVFQPTNDSARREARAVCETEKT